MTRRWIGAAGRTGRWIGFLAAAALVAACGGGASSETASPEPALALGALSVVAGTPGGPGMLDGNGRAARFRLNIDSGAAVDAAGNVYVADTQNDRIRRISPQGDVVTWATGATNARALAIDTQGNLFAADGPNNRILKISAAGVVTTLAGTGAEGSADGPAAAAQFIYPLGVAVTRDGTVYVGDSGNHTIRKISPDGLVSTLAGQTRVAGNVDGPGPQARFDAPRWLAVDETGTLWVSDPNGGAVRTVDAAGNVATAVRFGSVASPGSLATRNGVVYVQSFPSGAIQKVAGAALVMVAGQATSGYADGPAAAAQFAAGGGMAFDASGNLYLADALNSAVRKLDTQGTVSTLAGSPVVFGSTDGPASAASFWMPYGLAQDGAGSLYVSDYLNNRVRKIADGNVSTFAGAPGAGSPLVRPSGIVSDSQGNLDVVEGLNVSLRHITSSGALGASTSSAGERTCGGFCLNGGRGDVVRDGSGGFYISDPGWQVIRHIDAAGKASVVAGAPAADLSRYGPNGPGTYAPGTYSADGTGAAASFDMPSGLALDGAGNLYVADTANNTIRKITPAGVVSTFAGIAGPGGDADGPVALARFKWPLGIAFDAAGNLFVTDRGNSLVRKITPEGMVSTVAGQRGKQGVVAGALPATLNSPAGILVGSQGELYITDIAEHLILKITTP